MRSAPVSRSALLLLVLAFAGAPRARAETTTVDDLLARFRALPGLEAKFRDEQHMSLLAAPLVSTGTIHFAPPDRLARHTLEPERSSVLVDGHAVKFGNAAKSESVDLEGNPVAKLFVETFLRILGGDRAWLAANYGIAFKALPQDAWELELTPKNAPMNGIIRSLALHGRGISIDRMKMTEPSGDDTVTTFSDTNTAKTYTKDELARVFQLLPARGK